MKRFLSALLAVMLAVGLPFFGAAEAVGETEYDADLFTVTLPDDLYVFTQNNLTDDHPDAALFNMDQLRAYFKQNPEIYLYAYNDALDFELTVDISLSKQGMTYKALEDETIESYLIPTFVEGLEEYGATINDVGYVRQYETYIYWNISYEADGVTENSFSYQTCRQFGDEWYWVAIKMTAYDHELTDEMIAYLSGAVDTLRYHRFTADEVKAWPRIYRYSENGYTILLRLAPGYSDEFTAPIYGYDKIWHELGNRNPYDIELASFDIWSTLTEDEQSAYGGARDGMNLTADDAFMENLLKAEYGEEYFVGYRDIGEFRYAEFTDLSSSKRCVTEYVTVYCGVEYDFRFTLSAYGDAEIETIKNILETVAIYEGEVAE